VNTISDTVISVTMAKNARSSMNWRNRTCTPQKKNPGQSCCRPGDCQLLARAVDTLK